MQDINHSFVKSVVRASRKMGIFKSTREYTRGKSHTAVLTAKESSPRRRNSNSTSRGTRARDRGSASFAPRLSCTRTLGNVTFDGTRENVRSNVTTAIEDSQSNGP